MRFGRAFAIRAHLASQWNQYFGSHAGCATGSGIAQLPSAQVTVLASAAQATAGVSAPTPNPAPRAGSAAAQGSTQDANVETPGFAQPRLASGIGTALAPLTPTVVVGGFGLPPGATTTTIPHEVVVDPATAQAIATARDAVRPLVAGVATAQGQAFRPDTSSSNTTVHAAAAAAVASATAATSAAEIAVHPDTPAAAAAVQSSAILSLLGSSLGEGSALAAVPRVVVNQPTASAIGTANSATVILRLPREYRTRSRGLQWVTKSVERREISTMLRTSFLLNDATERWVAAAQPERRRVQGVSVTSNEQVDA